MIPVFVSDPHITRLLLTLAIIAFGYLTYRLINFLILLRASSHSNTVINFSLGKPVLLYFTTPGCTPCKTIQRPAIHRVQEIVGSKLEVVEIDASMQPQVASQWGVISVPTTFLIDSNGKPRHVNYGLAGVDKLLNQLEDMV
jgi:thioredoxin-like negative regulator of GroEL